MLNGFNHDAWASAGGVPKSSGELRLESSSAGGEWPSWPKSGVGTFWRPEGPGTGEDSTVGESSETSDGFGKGGMPSLARVLTLSGIDPSCEVPGDPCMGSGSGGGCDPSGVVSARTGS